MGRNSLPVLTIRATRLIRSRDRRGKSLRRGVGCGVGGAVGSSRRLEFSMDLILGVLPFADLRRPALGVSLLQAAVARRGFSSRVRYFNLDFAGAVGVGPYARITDELAYESLIGEWL